MRNRADSGALRGTYESSLRYVGVDDQCLPPDIVARWASESRKAAPLRLAGVISRKPRRSRRRRKLGG